MATTKELWERVVALPDPQLLVTLKTIEIPTELKDVVENGTIEEKRTAINNYIATL